MLKKCCFILFLFILFLTGCHQEKSYSDLNGKIIRLSDFRNKWIIINYWADWCKPCYEEVPELNAFNQKYAMKNAVILGVNYDGASVEQLKQWVKKLGIEFTVITSDPAKQLGIDPIPGLPTSIVIDPKGRIKKYLFGPQTQKSLNAVIGS